jgi:hypothetical protein
MAIEDDLSQHMTRARDEKSTWAKAGTVSFFLLNSPEASSPAREMIEMGRGRI